MCLRVLSSLAHCLLHETIRCASLHLSLVFDCHIFSASFALCTFSTLSVLMYLFRIQVVSALYKQRFFATQLPLLLPLCSSPAAVYSIPFILFVCFIIFSYSVFLCLVFKLCFLPSSFIHLSPFVLAFLFGVVGKFVQFLFIFFLLRSCLFHKRLYGIVRLVCLYRLGLFTGIFTLCGCFCVRIWSLKYFVGKTRAFGGKTKWKIVFKIIAQF